MRDPHPHRQHGAVNRNRPGYDWALAALFVEVIVSLYGLAGAWDEQSQLETQLVNAQLKHAADMGDAERDWSARVAAAYAQGQRDAVAGLTAGQGLEFAKACQAARMQTLRDREVVIAAVNSACKGGA